MRARPSTELCSLLHELSALVGLPGPDLEPADCDWQRWLGLVEEHQLSPLLGSRGAPEATRGWVPERPAEVENHLEGAYVHVARDSAFVHTELLRILAALRPVTDPVALKGAALAYALYDHPSERPMTDVDLLVAPEEAEPAAAVLRGLGYQPVCDAWEHHHLPPLRHPMREVTVELHTNLATPGLPEALLERMRSGSPAVELPDGSPMRILDPSARLVHHALHALRNPIGDPLLRNLFEVAWMAARLSRPRVQEALALAREAGMRDQVATAWTLAEQLFGRVHGVVAPAPGAVQHWCLQRLGWVTSDSEPSGRWSRWRSTLARQHLFAARAGASDRNPIQLIRPLVDSIADQGRHLPARLRGRLRRARSDFAEVGEGLLVENRETGEVHLLCGPAAAGWRAARDGIARRELRSRLESAGLERGESQQGIDVLETCGLLLPQGR